MAYGMPQATMSTKGKDYKSAGYSQENKDTGKLPQSEGRQSFSGL